MFDFSGYGQGQYSKPPPILHHSDTNMSVFIRCLVLHCDYFTCVMHSFEFLDVCNQINERSSYCGGWHFFDHFLLVTYIIVKYCSFLDHSK